MEHSTPNRPVKNPHYFFSLKYIIDAHKKWPTPIFRFYLKISLAENGRNFNLAPILLKFTSILWVKKKFAINFIMSKALFGVAQLKGKKGGPGLVVTHFVFRFLYFLHSIFRKAVIYQSFEWTPGYNCLIISFNRNTMLVNDHFIREGHLWALFL